MNPLQVIYEDNHIIAVNKRSGDIVQEDKTKDQPLNEMVKAYIKEKYKKPGDVFLGVIHRLDRPVSGVVLFARTSKALSRLNELFRERKVLKTYWAVVKTRPTSDSGTLVHYLKKDQVRNKSKAYDTEVPGSLHSVLDYKIIAKSDNYYLLELNPHTGRHHQNRAQLATMGCFIKGDVKYGFDRSNENASIHLHGRSLEFIHPIKKEKLVITAQTPDDPIWNYFEEVITGVPK